jgi:hypothetical protein
MIAVSHHQNVGQANTIKTANILFENMVQIKYWGMPVRNQNYILQEEQIKGIFASTQFKICFLLISTI